MGFLTIDYIVFITYCLAIIGIGIWVSQRGSKKTLASEDYFLAGKSLPWWVIGASVIASNISAEQFIGMSGSGYAIGLGIASYEWMGAITILIIAKYFLPIYIDKGIFTIPQFLELRFDKRVRTSLAVFWLGLYVLVNLTAVIYLGAKAMEQILEIPLIWGAVGLVVFSAAYSIYGGLKAVAFTDVIQVIFLILGGLITTYFALDAISDHQGVWAGFMKMLEKAPEKFDMILDPSNESYTYLPGISVLVGGLWMANLYYFGFNQYIIQRSLAAKNINEAQKGMAFAAVLKLILPLIVVVPGIAAYVLGAELKVSDDAYPWLISTFISPGLKGLTFAALIAAIVSSISSMVNSTATIFTMDIYKEYFNKQADGKQLILVGRITSAVALIIAVIIVPNLSNLDQVFQFIQKFTGIVSPGIVIIFLAGIFWKRATPNAALWVALLTIPISVSISIFIFPEMPFIDQIGITFLILSFLMILISVIESKENHEKSIIFQKRIFHTTTGFNLIATAVLVFLTAVYAYWW